MKLSFVAAICLPLSFAVSFAAVAGSEWTPGPRGGLSVVTSAFVRTTTYRSPDQTMSQVDSDGAYGSVNKAWNHSHEGGWAIDDQRHGFDVIAAGISYGRQDLVERGQQIIDWGFERQRPDGSFDCLNKFDGTAAFVEASAHAALLLQASSLRSQNEVWIAALKPRLLKSALWMTAADNAGPGLTQDAAFADRLFLNADALGETGMLLHHDALMKAARAYARGGVASQDPSGFFAEKGGSDTSYQAVTLLHAMTYYTLVANEDMRQQLYPKISWGFAWLDARTRPDGTLDQTGNTRTGKERGPDHRLATTDYPAASLALYDWHMITGDEHWAKSAQQLYAARNAETVQKTASGR